MIADGDSFKEVWLQAKVVDGLIKTNKKKPSEKFDLVFMKALLVAFCTIKAIQAGNPIEEGMLELLKDLFEWRVRKDENRMRTYDNLLNFAIDGIRKNNFN